MPEGRRLRMLFSSYHSYLDPSSGSTISVRDMFQLLTRRGWDCQVFAGPQLDYEDAKTIPQVLTGVGVTYQERHGTAHGTAFVLYNAIVDGVPVALYETPGLPPARKLTDAQATTHLTLYERVLEQFRPDVVVTYGGQAMAVPGMARARRAGAAVVFWLRNTAYTHREFFREVDGVVVPSAFSTAFYKKHLDLPTTAIPSAIDWKRVACGHVDRTYLTFVNPAPTKGVFVFAGLAKALARRRPDIPLLIVESRGGARWLKETGLDPATMPSLTLMPNTRDPKQFLGVTKALVAPSLWQETFGRVTAEAMVNGIPVLASDRGGLPEVVGPGGFVVPVPEQFTPDMRTVPSAEELDPWLDIIVRLWDDPSFYVTACLRARVEAEKWRPTVLGPRYDGYFRALVSGRKSAGREPDARTG